MLKSKDRGEWVNLPKLAKIESDYSFNSSVFLLISTLLIFKYLTPFPKFGIFVHTLVESGKDLINFSIVLSILLFGFAIIGHMLFGHVLEDFSSVGKFKSVFRILAPHRGSSDSLKNQVVRWSLLFSWALEGGPISRLCKKHRANSLRLSFSTRSLSCT